MHWREKFLCLWQLTSIDYIFPLKEASSSTSNVGVAILIKLRKFGIFCDLCLLCFSFVHQIFCNACQRYLNLSCVICDLGLVYFSSVHQLQLPRGYWHWGRRKFLHKEISIDPEKNIRCLIKFILIFCKKKIDFAQNKTIYDRQTEELSVNIWPYKNSNYVHAF